MCRSSGVATATANLGWKLLPDNPNMDDVAAVAEATLLQVDCEELLGAAKQLEDKLKSAQRLVTKYGGDAIDEEICRDAIVAVRATTFDGKLIAAYVENKKHEDKAQLAADISAIVYALLAMRVPTSRLHAVICGWARPLVQ